MLRNYCIIHQNRLKPNDTDLFNDPTQPSEVTVCLSEIHITCPFKKCTYAQLRQSQALNMRMPAILLNESNKIRCVEKEYEAWVLLLQ